MYKVQALIEPNNYTKITRPREVTFKAGDEVTVDMTKEDKKLDKIVVRWVPTPDDIVDKMAELAKISKDDIIFDPGCGDAVMLIRPVKKLGAKKGFGIDIDPKMVKIAQEKAKAEGVADKIVIKQGDILNEKDMADCAEATRRAHLHRRRPRRPDEPGAPEAPQAGRTNRLSPLHPRRLEAGQDDHDHGRGRRRVHPPPVGR